MCVSVYLCVCCVCVCVSVHNEMLEVTITIWLVNAIKFVNIFKTHNQLH